MEKFKAVCKKLLFPPVWLIVLLSLFSAAALITVFANGFDKHPIAYVIFVLSAYAVTVFCVFLVKTMPDYYRKAKQKFYEHPYGRKYMTDIGYKVRVSLYISLGINLIYSVFKLLSGIFYSSFWWGAIAVYYMVLSLMRFIILRYMRNEKDSAKNLLSEYRKYRLCGVLMLILNLSLTGIVFQMVWQNKAYSYPEIMIYAAAAYTFYSVTISIIDLIKYKKYHSPVMSASKTIRFASALVSLLSLETAMLAQFGNDESFRRTMTALTGAGVCIIVLGMSVFMVCNAISKMKGIKSNGK